MTPYRTILYIVKRKRKYHKLIWPFAFFLLEVSLIAMLLFNVLGVDILRGNGSYTTDPVVYVRMIHPLEIINPNEHYVENLPMFSVNPKVAPIHLFLYAVSGLVALIGLLISILWMNRFFKINTLNIEWWVWPTGCIGAHLMCFMVLL